jgi:hypothetical protein
MKLEISLKDLHLVFLSLQDLDVVIHSLYTQVSIVQGPDRS